MAVFTPIPKNRVKYDSPPPSAGSSVEYTFLIDDTYFLDIGDGFNLIIQPADTPTDWTGLSKTRNTYGSQITSTTFNLDIGEGFALLIDDTNQFIIEDGTRSKTPWTPTTRNKTNY